MRAEPQTAPSRPSIVFIVARRATALWWTTFGLITALAAFVRLWQLEEYPQRFNQDEMTLGYDAWSLWLTRRDQWDTFLPIHFRTFNDYVPPVANYITAPFVGTLGLSQFATRLPFALLGILTVVVCGLMARALFGRAAGLCAALLLALEPWHINFSRTAFPASIVPFFTACALFAYVKGVFALQAEPFVARRTALWLVASGVSFGLLGMSYPIEKVDGPLLVLVCLVAALPLFRRHWRLAVLWLVTMGVTASPVMYEQIFKWSTIQFRFENVSIFNTDDPWWLAMPRNYVSYYDPTRLFFDWFKGGISEYPYGVGNLLWVDLVFLIAGIIGIWRLQRIGQFNVAILLLGWFALYPLAASLTTNSPQEVRSLDYLPVPEVIAGYGAVCIWRALRGQRWRQWLMISLAAVLIAANSLVFLVAFLPDRATAFSGDPVDFRANIGLAPVSRAALQRLQPCDSVWMKALNQTYMYFLFTSQYPPQRYHSDPKVIGKNKYGFVFVQSFGQIHLANAAIAERMPAATLPPGCQATPGKEYWITDGAITKTALNNKLWRLVTQTTTTGGDVLWSLMEWTGS